MNLTEHFSLEEFTRSDTAVRLGINNTANADTAEALRQLCQQVLEPIRTQFGPVIITSGYRCQALNRAVGGSVHSQHQQGYAADIRILGKHPLTICRWLTGSEVPFDQLIQEGHWTHVSYCESARRQVLTAHFDQGQVRYSEGLVA